MKVQFTKGEGKIEVQFASEANGLRSTVLTVNLPGNLTLSSKVVCHPKDQFSRSNGRYAAFLKLINSDNDQASEKASKIKSLAVNPMLAQLLKAEGEGESLIDASRKLYKLCREDRRIVSKFVCPEFFANTPERKEQREKALFERLRAKYEPSFRVEEYFKEAAK